MSEKSLNSINIRDAQAIDRDEVQKIAFAVMRDYDLIPDPDGLDADLGRFGSKDVHIVCQLVAEVDDDVVGSVMISRTTNLTGKLSGFYMSPHARGKGIGRRLLLDAIRRSTDNGLKTVYLETLTSMQAAIHLYESLGWRRGPDLPKCSGAERSYLLHL